MRVLWFIVLCLAACSSGENIEKTVQNPQEEWLQEGVYNAAQFWQLHGVDFLIGDEGAIVVEAKEIPEEYWGMFYGNGLGGGTVAIQPYLEDELPDSWIACVVAHEFGHSVQMLHVKQGPNLMAPAFSGVDELTRQCHWSNLDQEEFCQANPDHFQCRD